MNKKIQKILFYNIFYSIVEDILCIIFILIIKSVVQGNFISHLSETAKSSNKI